MKNLYTTVACIIIGSSLFAQNGSTKAADKLFNSFEYVEAAQAYQELIDEGSKDAYVYKKLGDSYYNMFNISESIIWYKKSLQEPQDAQTYFRYAQMLKANGDYDEANIQMKKFAELSPNDLRAKEFLSNPDYLSHLNTIKESYTTKSISINTESADFGGLLSGNTLYFTSARSNSGKVYGWNKEPYLDIYQATMNEDLTFSEPVEVIELNSNFHDGPATLSKDGNTIYFSGDSFREDLFEKDKKNKLKLGKNNLYRASKGDGKWNSITSLPFNSNTYSVSNPSLSDDGKTLYFSSNMPGSIGGVDIWKVTVDGNSYGVPVNLGTTVNTEGNESFPFISEDNSTLYFASNGRQGFGGYDVFNIDLSTNSDAVNLGRPINSPKDDFAFSFNEAKKVGFLSSNRNGNDDIYQIFPICAVDLVVKVVNEDTSQVIANSKVTLLDSDKNLVDSVNSNENGEVRFSFDCDKDYTISASKDGFESNAQQFTKSNDKKATLEIKLKPIDVIITDSEVILKPIYFEFDKSDITSQGASELDKLIRVMKNNTALKILVKSHTDSKGSDSYNLKLSESRAKATVDYIISKGIEEQRISGKGFGELEPKVKCSNCTEEDDAQNRRSEFIIVN